MSASRLRYLLDKYLNNEYTSAELDEFADLLEQPEHEDEVKAVLAALAGGTKPGRVLSDEAAQQMLKNILGNDIAADQGKIKDIGKRAGKKALFMKWAAAAAVFAFFVLGIRAFMQQDTESPLSAAVRDAGNKVVVYTTTGERKEIVLPDGSKVWLSPSSALTYPYVFDNNKREVQLSGEAFFEVERAPEQPFIIYSGTIKTKVLGTSFNIQAYENQESIAVMVVTGKVKVSNDSEENDIELLPNQRAVFNKITDRLTKETTVEEQAPGMLKRKEGTFVYHNEPLQKITEDIEAYFGVKVEVAPPVKGCNVVASFEVTDSPASVLEIIAITIHGDLFFKNGTYIINGSGCPD